MQELYRGASAVHDDIDIQRCQHSIQKRIPLCMDEAVHKAINKYFIERFQMASFEMECLVSQ